MPKTRKVIKNFARNYSLSNLSKTHVKNYQKAQISTNKTLTIFILQISYKMVKKSSKKVIKITLTRKAINLAIPVCLHSTESHSNINLPTPHQCLSENKSFKC